MALDEASMAGAMVGLLMTFGLFIFILVIALYVYTSLAIMKIAQRLKVKNPWLAWIPIANLYLLTQCAQVPWWTMLVILVSWVPLIGGLAVAAVSVWWWWKIAERRGKEGWWGVLMLIPIVNFVIMGILAWGKK
ncbi:hypothetical protein HYV86_03210 [Candidatus Woesearchaeota archaeon]|nr:hypothetical protein [Candidatus Woesearchaeota archaeon]